MKPVTEVRQETAEVLGNAVAEVARRAIRPELDPFKQSLDSLVGKLEGHAEELEQQVRAEKRALDAVNKQLGDVVTAGRDQATAVAQTQSRVQELRNQLDALADELTATRDAQATTVAALNSLRDEVLGWMRASNEHAERLTSVLGRADALTDALRGQAEDFSIFGNALASKVDTNAQEVLKFAAGAREDAGRDASETQALLGAGFAAQGVTARAVTNELLLKIDTGAREVSSSVAAARQVGSAEMAALDAAQKTRLDAATAEVREIVNRVSGELAGRFDAGLLAAVERLQSGQQRTVDDVTALRTAAEGKLDTLQEELRAVLDRLAARHEDHGRELVRTGETAGRVFRLAVANLLLVVAALAVGGVALWVAMR